MEAGRSLHKNHHSILKMLTLYKVVKWRAIGTNQSSSAHSNPNTTFTADYNDDGHWNLYIHIYTYNTFFKKKNDCKIINEGSRWTMFNNKSEFDWRSDDIIVWSMNPFTLYHSYLHTVLAFGWWRLGREQFETCVWFSFRYGSFSVSHCLLLLLNRSLFLSLFSLSLSRSLIFNSDSLSVSLPCHYTFRPIDIYK